MSVNASIGGSKYKYILFENTRTTTNKSETITYVKQVAWTFFIYWYSGVARTPPANFVIYS